MANFTINQVMISFFRAMEKASNVLAKCKEAAKVWDRKFINDLPNSAFAVIEKGYKEGDDMNARHLPHHGMDVKSGSENTSVDMPHYRSALTRVNQIKSVLGTESDAALRKRAAAHLDMHRSMLKVMKEMMSSSKDKELWEECEKLFEANVKPLL